MLKSTVFAYSTPHPPRVYHPGAFADTLQVPQANVDYFAHLKDAVFSM